MTTSPKPESAHRRHRATLIAAATAVPRESPHAVDDAPHVFEFTPAQIAQMRTLQFLTDYQIAHTAKVSPDVAGSLDQVALRAIETTPALGGPERLAAIQTLMTRHEELAAIAAILAPLTRLVGQNILATDAALAQHVGEVLGVAHKLAHSQPHLEAQLKAPSKWSHDHHSRGQGTAASAAPGATPATRPAT